MKTTNYSTLFLLLLLLNTFCIAAQDDPSDCQLPSSFLTGDYTLIQTTPIHAENANQLSFENQLINIEILAPSTPSNRFFKAVWLEGIGFENPTFVSFALDCSEGNDIVLNDITTPVSCGDGFVTLGPASTTGTFDENNDGSFTLILAEYVNDGGCNVPTPLVTEFTLTKCSVPDDVSFTNQTSTSIDLNWTDLGDSFNIEYGVGGFELGTGQTITNVMGDNLTIENLQGDTLYDFYFIKSCSGLDNIYGPFPYANFSNTDFTFASNGVTCLCPDADFEDVGSLEINGEIKTFTKRSRTQLDDIIADDIQNPQIALTCTSGITDMSNLFSQRIFFNQNLEHWDVSNVTNMASIFGLNKLFNQPIDSWDVSNVTSFYQAFAGAQFFNQPIDSWDVSNVTNMNRMFFGATSFNQPLNTWNVSNVQDMTLMFGRFVGTCPFNQPLDNWDVSSVTNMNSMFSGGVFNQPINDWDVSSVTTMNSMFVNSEYNQPLDNWNVSAVSDMSYLFKNANFNQDISNWCVEQILEEPFEFSLDSSLENEYMPNWGENCELINLDFFLNDEGEACLCPDAEIGELGTILIGGELITFTKRSENSLRSLIDADINNPQIALTCTSEITDMHELFKDKEDFNQSLQFWDVSNVTNMNSMFESATSFGSSLNDFWESEATTFNTSSSPLSAWNVSNVLTMDDMFKNATSFNQDISNWCVEQIEEEPNDFALDAPLQIEFFPDWGADCETFSINNEDFSSFSIYPNPVRNQLTFNWGDMQVNEKVKIQIYSITGKEVFSRVFNQQPTSINLRDLATGVYFLKLNSGSKSAVRKILKK